MQAPTATSVVITAPHPKKNIETAQAGSKATTTSNINRWVLLLP
jgi:hypothetical protein